MTIISFLLVLVAATPSAGAADVTLLDFHSEGCGPCRQMRPTIERLAEAGLPIKAIDVDKSPKWAERYSVHNVPTFIAVDPEGNEIARTMGAQPASNLVEFIKDARLKANRIALASATRRPAPERESRRGDDKSGTADESDGEASESDDSAGSDDPSSGDRFENPKAWETVVRIRVLGQGSIGFGSGTIIYSTREESLILTCAHVFKLDGQRRQPHPTQFPKKIMIDLFDGNLQGTKPAHVTFTSESVEGKAVDYDFTLDVGLIRIRPGHRLPSARVVPAHWNPTERMHMLTVGCSEGHDASVWATRILKPKMKGLSGNPNYEAIECAHAPRQGRSGGGLFTDDGYVAGVCNFAETHGDVGLYATPTSIYRILDRNKLMALYAPVNSAGARLVADNGSENRVRPGTRRRDLDDDGPAMRGQSPDRDDERQASKDPDSDVLIPSPEMLGVKLPGSRKSRISRHSPVAVSDSSSEAGRWQLKSNSSPGRDIHPKAEPTDVKLDRSVEVDPFENFNGGEKPSDGRADASKRGSRTESSPDDQLDWRPVN